MPDIDSSDGVLAAAAVRALDRGGVVAVNAIHLDRLPEMPYDDLWWERSIRSVANVTRARNQIDDVEWSAEDATRTDLLHGLVDGEDAGEGDNRRVGLPDRGAA